ncbi:RICIN domain-containing protein [Kitasatospora sp. NPDC002227]|uniref:MGH1-like glycoside hydrolase domain-containing protein n=1 Tax=Kitasatospora sp. NPDC002227 TaxID=3154773 RepID=UPI003328494F
MRRHSDLPHRVLFPLLSVALAAAVLPGVTRAQAAAATGASVIDEDAVLAAQGLAEPQWYKDNIPFLDTPDSNINGVYYYRWSTYKQALRYTTPGTGYIATEYDQPVWYSGNASYSGLSDAAGYHILDGRWLRDRTYLDDYLDYWLRGSGEAGARGFSESITSAAYQRYLATGDATQLKADLPQLIALYDKWSSNYTRNITVNGAPTDDGLYFQSPLSDATEYTETSMHSTNWFSGGSGYRPTINSYLYAAAQAIGKVAAMTGDSATASTFSAKASALKTGVQDALWDPQRNFFMQVYNDNSTNGGLAWTRTTWREAMGYTPWAFELPDAKYSSAWQYVNDPQRFGASHGPTTLERTHDLEAEQAAVVHANVHGSPSASNGQYVGQIDYPDSAVTFTVNAPGAGTYPVTVHYANATGATSTQNLTVDGAATPITVSYPPTSAWGSFAPTQTVTVQVPLNAGANTLKFTKGTGFAELDEIAANPYFDYQASPAVQHHDDTNCCHWNGPSWPFDTSAILTGMANLLQDYPAQGYVTKQTYDTMLSQFATLQHRGGKPYVAEAADGDTGDWLYDASDFSENYNHSSFNDLVLTGLLGIKPQADDTLVLKPLVPDSWDWFALQDLPYHGHTLTVRWDRDGTHYHQGSGLQVFQDGTRIHQSAGLGTTTVLVAAPIVPVAKTRLENVAANAWTADQDWFKGWDNRSYQPTYPKAFASYTNTGSNGLRCRSADNPRCVQAHDSPLKAIDGFVGYEQLPDDRWTNTGSPNATDYLGVDFGAERPVDEVKLYTYDDGQNVRAPQSFDLQYLSGSTWTSVPGQTRTPAAPVANGPEEVTFPTVTTSQLRVVLTPQPGKSIGVTELESWYPQTTVRIVNRNSGLPLGVPGASTAAGAAVVQQTADNGGDQQWRLEPAGGGYYKIVNRNSGLVLGVSGAATTAGATALLWGDNLTPDHLWSLVDAGGGYRRLVNRNSGLLLGVQNASTTPGAAALQWSDNGTADHLWSLEPVG